MPMVNQLILFVLQNAPSVPGQATPIPYFLLNLLVPVILGVALAWLTHRLEKILLRLIREKR